jgi:hypothetical protein
MPAKPRYKPEGPRQGPEWFRFSTKNSYAPTSRRWHRMGMNSTTRCGYWVAQVNAVAVHPVKLCLHC